MPRTTRPATSRYAVPARALLAVLPALALLLTVALPAGAAPSTGQFRADVEPLARYVGQSTCDPTEKPGTVALRALVQATYPSVNGGGIVRACESGGRSEHKEGRAWDWMLDASDPEEAARAEDFLSWLLAPDAQGNRFAMARRLGVMYVIWDARVWESYAADEGWTPYSGPVPHTDHIHISLSWDGALGRTSFWDGSGPAPAPATPPAPSTPPAVSPDPFGALDEVRVEASGVRLRGWVIDPDAPTFTTLRVTADGVPVTSSLADQHVEHLVTAQPGFSPRHGFDVLVPLPAGTREVCATGVNQNQGSDLLLGCRTPSAEPAAALPEPGAAPVPTPGATTPALVPPVRAVNDSCPAPLVPRSGFTDTAGSVHAAAVDCVVWWEIASGLNATTYAPGNPVSRGQMATFLARTVLASGGTLPDAPQDAFSDDEGSLHERAIDQLAAAGISNGLGDGRYDPAGTVTRGQMATFLAKTWAYRTGRTLPVGADYFTDDDGNVHEASIGRVARVGFTGGLEAGRYGPLASTVRGQMATFLTRLLDLLVEAGDAQARD